MNSAPTSVEPFEPQAQMLVGSEHHEVEWARVFLADSLDLAQRAESFWGHPNPPPDWDETSFCENFCARFTERLGALHRTGALLEATERCELSFGAHANERLPLTPQIMLTSSRLPRFQLQLDLGPKRLPWVIALDNRRGERARYGAASYAGAEFAHIAHALGALRAVDELWARFSIALAQDQALSIARFRRSGSEELEAGLARAQARIERDTLARELGQARGPTAAKAPLKA